MNELAKMVKPPKFYVTQSEYDAATKEEREYFRVYESILPPPVRYTRAKDS